MKVEVQLLIPVRGNDGAAFGPEHHAQFEAALVEAFGGWQRLPGLVSGEWADDAGTVYGDDLRVYVVAADGLFANAGKFAAAFAHAKNHYAQLAVYVRYLGVSEIV